MTLTQRRLVRWLGYPALSLFVFIMTAHFFFPYERVKERLAAALSSEYDVSIESVSPGLLPGRLRIKGMTLTTRPVGDGVKPVTLLIDHVDVNIGILALIGKKFSIGVDAVLGDGEVTGRVEKSEDEIFVDLHTRDLPLDSVPGVAVITGGAPIKGGLEANFSIRLPQGKWAAADGRIEVSCADCTIGDGVTKVRPVVPGQTNAFTGGGFTLPRIKLGQVEGKVVITKGIACIETFHTKSPHGELRVEGGLKLADPFAQSQTQLYTRVQLSDAFRKESPRNLDFDNLFFAGAKLPDGAASYQARTSISLLRWLPAKVPPPPMKECGSVVAPAPPPPTTAAIPPPTVRPGAPVPPTVPGAATAPMPTPAVAARGQEGEPWRAEMDAPAGAVPTVVPVEPPSPTVEAAQPPTPTPEQPPREIRPEATEAQPAPSPPNPPPPEPAPTPAPTQ
ncbi:MAG TPA: type II secretion system protein GspN [Haliangiales bacterium]|nr:type II secretion system protein GspN [Haliangiales bacterium]